MGFLSRNDVRLYLYNEARTDFIEIRTWNSLEATKEEHDLGPLVLTTHPGAAWVAQAAADLSFDWYDGWEGLSLDLVVRDLTTGTYSTAYSGPIIDVTLQHSGTEDSALATLTCETFTGHGLRRRVVVKSTLANDVWNDYPDNVILDAAATAWHASTKPSGYGTGTRDNFGGTWSFTASANSPAQAAATKNVQVQGGVNLLDFAREVAEYGDCWIGSTETSAATWDLDVLAPYQSTSKVNAVHLSVRNNSVTSLNVNRTMTALVNKFIVKGNGSGASQTVAWGEDTTSGTARGWFEGSAPAPENSANDSLDLANKIVTTGAEPILTIDVESQASGLEGYNSSLHWPTLGQRYLVSWSDPIFDISGTAMIRGWTFKQSGTADPQVVLKLGSVTLLPGSMRQLASAHLLRGGRMGGGMYWNRSS